MTNGARGALLIALLGSGPVSGTQLPPEIPADQLLLRAERLMEGEEPEEALEALEEILTLQAEHGIELPPEFHFRRAQATFAAGTLEPARESVIDYLTAAGRDGEFYEAALVLLEDVERILERRDAPDCTGQPAGTECWMELANQPGCHVGNEGLQLEAVAEWTGACSSGFATGPGTLTWEWPPDNRQKQQGTMRLGRPEGSWVERFPNGVVAEGPYEDGEESGRWVIREPDGGVDEGPYVNGARNGQWFERFANGTFAKGAYVDGRRNGHGSGHIRTGRSRAAHTWTASSTAAGRSNRRKAADWRARTWTVKEPDTGSRRSRTGVSQKGLTWTASGKGIGSGASRAGRSRKDRTWLTSSTAGGWYILRTATRTTSRS